MFDKILIANRGEIACRAMKTAHQMRISTVAVYSDADRDALHVRLADEAVRLGPPPSNESYLQIEKIVQACKQTGAEAVYPGYGFLSENPAFARRLEEENIVFIGPNVRAIEAMGDKITSKRLAHEAGVNTIPGFNDVVADGAQAVAIARDIGYPVMLKASAGGGGKGMRIAHDDAQCRDGFERASNEARSSFGDARVFIEKYVVNPRHIEIQVLADTHGKVLYLNERECSIQRRHQKVIEEAPSPFLDAATRAAMGEQAVALARAVEYRSAGTVEFIVDAQRNFYFLEMNTRLQVEHPVTEKITGLDLIEWMLRIGAGEALPFSQDDIGIDGWALEARIYAENPLRDFLPSTGRLTSYAPPPASDKVRVDTGVYEGGEVSIYYDPIIAKLITWGSTRDEAIGEMRRALDAYLIRGVESNIAFLAALMEHPRFIAGELSTDFIAEEYPEGFSAAQASATDADLLSAVAATVHACHVRQDASISGQLPGYSADAQGDWVVVRGREETPLTLRVSGLDWEIDVAGAAHRVSTDWRIGEPMFRATVNNEPVCVQVERHGAGYRLKRAGIAAECLVLTPEAARLNRLMPIKRAPDLSHFLLAPMPGLLVSLSVQPGQKVKAGEELAVIEAMKMENSLRAERDGVVKKVLCASGDTLDVDQPIVEFA